MILFAILSIITMQSSNRQDDYWVVNGKIYTKTDRQIY